MSHSAVLGIALLALLALGAVVLVVKLLWPAAPPVADPDDPWAQHNDTRMPSLEHPAEPGQTEVDAAVAAQINGVD